MLNSESCFVFNPFLCMFVERRNYLALILFYMKYQIHAYLKSAAIVIILLSCFTSCDDFLSSIRNENNQDIESLLYDLNDLDVCINGAYGAFVSANYYGKIVLTQILGSDEATNNKNSTIIPDFQQISGDNYFFGYQCNTDDYQAGFALQWSSFVSNNSNLVIKSIEDKLPRLTNLRDTLNANRLLGEAFLLRATVEYYNNFYIGRQYHTYTLDQPSTLYRKKPILGFDDLAEPRKTVGEVYRFIISDLQRAKALLPVEYIKSIHPIAYQFRFKRDVATAMLAKVYFQKNDFDSCLIQINDLLGNTKSSSVKFPLQQGINYHQLFKITDKTNFQPGNNSEIIMGFHGNTAFQPTIASRWHGFQWTAFKNLQNNDVSHAKFRIVFDSSFVKTMLAGDTGVDVRFRQMIYITRNQGKEKPSGQWTSLKYAFPTSNIIWLRAAEFHLMRAEVFLHNNKIEDAISELNLIRMRAGLSGIQNPISKTELYKAIIEERSRELCFENVRRSDNLRLASLSDSPIAAYLPAPYQSGYIPTGNRSLLNNDSLKSWNSDQLYCLMPNNEYLNNPALNK